MPQIPVASFDHLRRGTRCCGIGIICFLKTTKSLCKILSKEKLKSPAKFWDFFIGVDFLRFMHKLIDRIFDMCRLSYIIFKWMLLISCAMLALSLLILVYAGGFSIHTYTLYQIARELFNLPVAVLLLGSIASVCIEEATLKK